MAQARLSRLEPARKTLRQLHQEGHLDPETLGIYARTWYDLYDRTGRKRYLTTSRNLYAEGFKANPEDYYTGINAAAKSVFLDERDAAEAYAGQVERIVGRETKPGDYWLSATVAEVQLIRKNYSEAAQLYAQAVDLAPRERGSHSTTWLQAKRLMRAMKTPPDDQKPGVGGFQAPSRRATRPSRFRAAFSPFASLCLRSEPSSESRHSRGQ